MTAESSLVIDAVANLFTPEVVSTRPAWSAGHMNSRFGVDFTHLAGVPLETQLALMDAAGVNMAVLLVQRMGSEGTPESWIMEANSVVKAVEEHPDRFAGQAGVDPTAGVSAIKELRSLVRDHGFVGAHFYPHWFDLSPDDRRVFPIYQECEDLGIPIQIQVGQALVYTRRRPAQSVGRPMSLEPIALHFPGLKVIGSHLGFPWTDELIALANIHENVYLCTDSYAPRYWPSSLDRFVAGGGSEKVMFGTMWPTIGFDRAVQEIREKALPPGSEKSVLGLTAAAVYGLAAKWHAKS